MKTIGRSTVNTIIPRRDFLVRAGATAAGIGALLSTRVARPADETDPRASALGQVRMLSTLDGSPAFWAYSGTVYAVRPAERPLPLFDVSGCQSQWARRTANGDYRMAGMLLSYFRAIASDAFLDEWTNPFTGRRNAVRANRFIGGSAIYPADGAGMHLERPVAASESAPGGIGAADRPAGPVKWTLTSDRVSLRTDHAFDVAVQPQTEAQTVFADRIAFFDPAVVRLPALYAATTVIPWMRWMDMADVPGHLVWHTSGEKFFSIDHLPSDYRARAGAALDAFLERPAALDAPPA